MHVRHIHQPFGLIALAVTVDLFRAAAGDGLAFDGDGKYSERDPKKSPRERRIFVAESCTVFRGPVFPEG